MIIRVKKGPAKHEKAAIYAVNQRISNVYRIARVALQRSKAADFECLKINGKRIKAVIRTGDNCK